MKEQHVSTLRRSSGTIFLMILSVLCAVVSGILLFMPEVPSTTLCSILSAALIVWGIAQISRFFVMEAYHQLHDYSFSSGALLVILGCVALVRVNDVAAHLEVVLQLAVLCLGVVLVQNTIQLRSTNSQLWSVEGILALGVLACAVLSLTAPAFLQQRLALFTHWSLLVAGVINTLSFPLVAYNLYKHSKRLAAQAAVVELEKGRTPKASSLPLASFGDTDELDVAAIRAKAEEQTKAEAD